MEKEIVNKLSIKFRKKREVMQIMLTEYIKLGYNINEFETILTEFYTNYSGGINIVNEEEENGL